MQKPQRDLPKVLLALTTAHNPADLRAAVNKFYTHDASLHHPLSIVEHGENSKQDILGVYEWYRIVSPNTTSNVTVALYDSKSKTTIAHVTQQFNVRISPFKAAPSRYIIRLELKEHGGLYYIYSEEISVHPTDLMNSLLPPLTPVVRLALIFCTFMAVAVPKVWSFGLLLLAKLFGIGSDVQRGKTKWGLKRFT
ncbi:hypothetical protein DFH29DRAFT_839440 [Suillus ampliporus]|nr:hypothetical protein DFH29DRAFT_839440 [Suillus ampliporus]